MSTEDQIRDCNDRMKLEMPILEWMGIVTEKRELITKFRSEFA